LDQQKREFFFLALTPLNWRLQTPMMMLGISARSWLSYSLPKKSWLVAVPQSHISLASTSWIQRGSMQSEVGTTFSIHFLMLG